MSGYCKECRRYGLDRNGSEWCYKFNKEVYDDYWCMACEKEDDGCYLTSLVCEILGYEDDCYELEFLRSFRDNYLSNLPEGKQILDEYKTISQSIIPKIKIRDDKVQIAEKVRQEYISPAIQLIKDKRQKEGIELYKNMVVYLQSF